MQSLPGDLMKTMNVRQSKDSVKTAGIPMPRAVLEHMYRTPEPAQEERALIRLDRNERIGEWPAWFLNRLRDAIDSSTLAAYPRQERLRNALAKDLDVSEEQLVLTPGSDAAFKAIYQAYVRTGDRIVMLDPSYAMYPVYAQMFEAEAVRVSFEANRTLDTKALLERITNGVRLVVLANPNQPTGTLIDPRTIRSIAERAAAAEALLVIDEAYYPFSKATVIPWLRQIPQLIVTRTFSKAAGLAGLRIGYVVGHPDVVANVAKVRTAYDINSMAILCAEQLLAEPQIIADYVAEVEAGRRTLSERATKLGLGVLPTHTNFLLIRVTPRVEPSRIVAGLRRFGFVVKGPFDAPCLAGCIRITLGPAAIMAKVAESLERLLNE